ncbi:hypothetical protein BGY98DRAFT_954104 [Russula aff. rugulosa BPL654]|nr:hypothetical protein BGY98DRAFT_954104 [Russula aff. rugulosa BPL654]
MAVKFIGCGHLVLGGRSPGISRADVVAPLLVAGSSWDGVLKPGALYAECAVTPIRIPTTLAPSAEEKTDGGGDRKTPGGGTTAPDDGEYCIEVWDDYEREQGVGSCRDHPGSKRK